MNIRTSKDQTISGQEADTVVGLAVVGATAIIGASAAAVGLGLNLLAVRIGTGSWKIWN